MPQIDKGSSAAWSTRTLIEALWEEDEVRFQEAFDAASAYAPTVLWNLTILAGGAVNAIALRGEQPFDDMLASIWSQIASWGDDATEGALMRAAVTAWSEGESGNAETLNESGAFDQADPQLLVMHFAAVIKPSCESIVSSPTKPLSPGIEQLWKELGTED